MSAPVTVSCAVDGDSWQCTVAVEADGASTSHTVGVSRAELERYATGHTAPDELVAESFAFLLEREPAGSILRSFELSTIGRYFPEYGREIVRRMAGRDG